MGVKDVELESPTLFKEFIDSSKVASKVTLIISLVQNEFESDILYLASFE
jgi:hypothetical protein